MREYGRCEGPLGRGEPRKYALSVWVMSEELLELEDAASGPGWAWPSGRV